MARRRGGARDKSGGKGLYFELRVRHNGKQPSRGFTGDPNLSPEENEAAAYAALDRWIAELNETLTAQSTCADMLWLYWRRRCRDNTEGSNETMRQRIEDHLIPLIGHRKVVAVTTGEVETLYDQLRAKGLSRETVRKIHFILRPAFALAKRQGVRPDNPCGEGKEDTKELLGAARKYKANAPRIDMLAAIYKVASDRGELDTCLYIRILIITGDRRSESCGLQWGDIDWEACSLVLRRSVVVVRGKLIIQPFDARGDDAAGGKGDAAMRPIALDPGTIDALLEFRELIRAAGGNVDDDAFIFADWDRAIDGSIPRRPSTWTSRWRAHAKRAGVKVRLHDCRHGSLSWQMAAGLNPVDVARRGGHSRTSTTTDLYGHVVVTHADRNAAEMLGDKFSQVEGAATAPVATPPPVRIPAGLAGSRRHKAPCEAPCGCDRVSTARRSPAPGLDPVPLCPGHYAQAGKGQELRPLKQYRRHTKVASADGGHAAPPQGPTEDLRDHDLAVAV